MTSIVPVNEDSASDDDWRKWGSSPSQENANIANSVLHGFPSESDPLVKPQPESSTRKGKSQQVGLNDLAGKGKTKLNA